jgi:hypothetical protein
MLASPANASPLCKNLNNIKVKIRERGRSDSPVEARNAVGNAEAYWFAAQREIVGASLGSFAPMIAPEVSDKKPTKNAKAARKRRAS